MNPKMSLSCTSTTDEREKKLLAPYAMFSCNSAGRVYDEPEHPDRGPYQRDRDRILHSSAFRRLSGKTQVFTGQMGDYHRTRLTHTFEVATIARTLARALGLNEDLVEALALVHDIGHPPYGHAGEDVLNDCLSGEGGFSHNRFALTLVTEIEVRHTRTPGLNLTREVLEGQVARIEKDSEQPRPLLEVQLVDAADSTTYDAHDTDDALKLELVSLDEMCETRLIGEIFRSLGMDRSEWSASQIRKAVVYRLIDVQVSDLLQQARQGLESAGFDSADAAMSGRFLIGPGSGLAEKKQELESFLYERVYRHPRLMAVRGEAQRRLKKLFNTLVASPERMPRRFQYRIDRVGTRRAVAEFIAGMTDHYCDSFSGSVPEAG